MTRSTSPARTRAQARGAVLAAVTVALLLTGCAPDSGSPSGDDSAGGSTPAGAADAVAYAQCMRDNGVPGFPDPDSDGGFDVVADELGVPIDSDQYRNAEQTCAPLLPTQGSHVQDEDYQAVLRYAQCMRDEGVPGYPDPPAPAQGPDTKRGDSGDGAAIDRNSPQFQAAHEACKSLLPDGGDEPGMTEGNAP